MAERDNDLFYSYVLTYYRNDPYIMMDKFSDEIARVASEVSIDWDGTRDNVSLNSKKVSGNKVKGETKADENRVWVIGYENEQSTNFNNVIKYPVIRFQNFRKHFPEPVYFSGMKVLWDEFKKRNQGERISRPKYDRAEQSKRLEKLKQQEESDRQDQLNAISRDWRWLNSTMQRRQSSCPYLSKKGLGDAHEYLELYKGVTSKGVVGEFTAVKAIDIKTGSFAGIQRLYPDCKVFRKGLNPNGTAWFSNEPVDGDEIYVQEAVADAGLAYKLTSTCSAAAFYADNIPIVARLLRERYPNSKLIFIADNDQYSDPNKGVESCVKAINLIGDNFELYVPEFQEDEKAIKRKDLTDFCLAYGEAETLSLITAHKRR